MNREECLDEVKKRFCEEHDRKYGRPKDIFDETAKYWSDYLGTELGAEDVAIMMALRSIVGITGSSYEDKGSWIKACGYLACGAEIALGSGKPESAEKAERDERWHCLKENPKDLPGEEDPDDRFDVIIMDGNGYAGCTTAEYNFNGTWKAEGEFTKGAEVVSWRHMKREL